MYKISIQKLIFSIVLSLPLLLNAQKWYSSVDAFTKAKSWNTNSYDIKIKKIGGFLSDEYLNIYLLKTQRDIKAVIGFYATLRYESLTTAETQITILYENDSTITIKPDYTKSSLSQLLGKSWYHTTIMLDVPPLREAIKGIRIRLNEYNKDYFLKDDGITGLHYFINNAIETMPHD